MTKRKAKVLRVKAWAIVSPELRLGDIGEQRLPVFANAVIAKEIKYPSETVEPCEVVVRPRKAKARGRRG